MKKNFMILIAIVSFSTIAYSQVEIAHSEKGTESYILSTNNVPTSFIYSIYNNTVSTFPVQIGSFNCFKQYYTIKHLEKKSTFHSKSKTSNQFF